MQPFQQRVVDEKKELDEKIEKLADFLRDGPVGDLPGEERGRLYKQFDLMKEYSDVLGKRIAAFK